MPIEHGMLKSDCDLKGRRVERRNSRPGRHSNSSGIPQLRQQGLSYRTQDCLDSITSSYLIKRTVVNSKAQLTIYPEYALFKGCWRFIVTIGHHPSSKFASFEKPGSGSVLS